MAREAILYRTKFVEHRKNRWRFSDWNIVNTSIGACWEPVSFSGTDGAGVSSMGLDDCINRVDELSTDFDWRDPHYRDEYGEILIGGNLSLGRDHNFLEDDNNIPT